MNNKDDRICRNCRGYDDNTMTCCEMKQVNPAGSCLSFFRKEDNKDGVDYNTKKMRKILLDFGHAWDTSETFGEDEVKIAIDRLKALTPRKVTDEEVKHIINSIYSKGYHQARKDSENK